MATQPIPNPNPQPAEAASAAGDEFATLEAKIQRVAEALQQARAERDRALSELEPLRSALNKLQQAQALAERELVGLRKERNEIRQRVNRLVSQLEASIS